MDYTLENVNNSKNFEDFKLVRLCAKNKDLQAIYEN